MKQDCNDSYNHRNLNKYQFRGYNRFHAIFHSKGESYKHLNEIRVSCKQESKAINVNVAISVAKYSFQETRRIKVMCEVAILLHWDTSARQWNLYNFPP